MPNLTVTEKEHWKERIARRIDKRIEVVCAGDPNLMDRIRDQARQRALQSLGLAAMQAELDAVEKQKENLLDTIWLATSPNQIRQLWQKVIELLGDEQTILQKEALAIGAVERD